MSRTIASRRAVAELRAGTGQAGCAMIGSRSIHQFWHLLAPHFRDVFLAPQRRPDGGGVSWTWREPVPERPPTAGELADVRRRLETADRLLAGDPAAPALNGDAADGDRGTEVGAQVRAGAHTVVARLITAPDSVLAGFVGRTEAGLMVHSWGAAAPAPPYFPDTLECEISGRVRIGEEDAAGLNIVIENRQGAILARAQADGSGAFRFQKIGPGNYRIRVPDRGDFPATGVPVTVERESIIGLELHRGTSVATFANPNPPGEPRPVAPAGDSDSGAAGAVSPSGARPTRRRRRRMAMGIVLLALIVVGGGWWRMAARPATISSRGASLSWWQLASGAAYSFLNPPRHSKVQSSGDEPWPIGTDRRGDAGVRGNGGLSRLDGADQDHRRDVLAATGPQAPAAIEKRVPAIPDSQIAGAPITALGPPGSNLASPRSGKPFRVPATPTGVRRATDETERASGADSAGHDVSAPPSPAPVGEAVLEVPANTTPRRVGAGSASAAPEVVIDSTADAAEARSFAGGNSLSAAERSSRSASSRRSGAALAVAHPVGLTPQFAGVEPPAGFFAGAQNDKQRELFRRPPIRFHAVEHESHTQNETAERWSELTSTRFEPVAPTLATWGQVAPPSTASSPLRREPEGGPRPTDFAGDLSTQETRSAIAFDLEFAALVRRRVRASDWIPRLMQDVILPTQPVRLGEKDSVEAAREKLLAERRAQMPPAFRHPVTTSGFALEISSDNLGPGDRPRWCDAQGAEAAGTSVHGSRAEVSWPGVTPPHGLALFLLNAAGRAIARVGVDLDGLPIVETATEMRSWYWVGIDCGTEESDSRMNPATRPRCDWRFVPGGPVPASWPRDDTWHDGRGYRLDWPLASGRVDLGSGVLALVDEVTGWALVGGFVRP